MGSRLPMILGLFLSALIGVWAWGAAGRWLSSASPPAAPPGLQIVYPPAGHRTTSNRIFLIGTAPARQPVTVNGQRIQRSPAGHFAPSFPLTVGTNRFQIQAGPERLELEVRRELPPVQPEPLRPAGRVARRVHEPLCFAAVAPPQTRVELSLGNQRLTLQPDAAQTLPANSAVLTEDTHPRRPAEQVYRGCLTVEQPGNLGRAKVTLGPAGRVIEGQGDVEILPASPGWVAVFTEVGITRTGPSTDHSRLTPLPAGVEAQVTGWEGDWVRLDYGAWVLGTQVRLETRPAPPRSVIRGVVGQVGQGWTDLRFPLERRVPYQVDQGEGTFTLTLENTTAQTDTIRLDDGPLVQRLDWSQPKPGQVRYSLRLKTPQPWGYRLRYEDTTLILSLRHPPQLRDRQRPLTGQTILLDPGHGGPQDLGARGPTGFPEKEATLFLGRALAKALEPRGATVILTRTQDVDLGLGERVAQIERTAPLVALSLHYNALPDQGDAERIQGVGAFWYHAHSQPLAVFLQNHLVTAGRRPSYGVFWGNLALARPTVCPAVLLELGFMINPQEFEWITDPQAQAQLAQTLAQGLEQWLRQQAPSP